MVRYYSSSMPAPQINTLSTSVARFEPTEGDETGRKTTAQYVRQGHLDVLVVLQSE